MDAHSATAYATEALLQRIVTAEMLPGTSLNQSAIAKELGVSRIPVRDALVRLQAQRMVEIDGSVATVAPMSMQDLEEIYEMREAIEPVATRIAVVNVGRAELLQMEEMLEAMREPSSLADWLTANRSFHRLIYGQSHRTRMIDLIDSLAQQTDRYLFRYVDDVDDALTRFSEQHEMILNAARDRASARETEDLTKLHLATGHRMIIDRMLRGSLDSPSTSQSNDYTRQVTTKPAGSDDSVPAG